MKDGNGYMDDRELEALIAEVENGGMIAPPVYLKEWIMEEVKRQQSDAYKGREAPREELVRAAKRRFFSDSLKIAAAAAAAVFCLTEMPVNFSGGGMVESSRIERRIEEDTERYHEEKQRALADEDGISGGLGEFLENRLGWEFPGEMSPAGMNRIFDGFSNWFGMEEKDYE